VSGTPSTGAPAAPPVVPPSRAVSWARRLPRVPLTIRARLTVIYGGAFLLAGLVLVFVMYLLVRNRLGPRDRMWVRSLSGDPATLLQEGTTTRGSVPVPPPGAGVAAQEYVGQVKAAIIDYDEGTLDALLRYSIVAVFVLLLLAGFIGWLMAGRVLHPLQEITATARRASERNLHERIALAGPQDELKELAVTFDAMLERLDQAFAGQRRFVANASHELRTPLAVSRTVLEVALGDPAVSGDLRQVGRTLLATNERSERLIDGLLALANGDSEPALRVPVDLADVAAQTVEQVAAEAGEREVSVTSDLGPAPVTGDGVLLERLTLNLLQNGIRHNTPGGWVEVTTTTAAGGVAEIVVANSGPVVPPYEVDTLFEPFRRLNAQRVGSDRGVGLGLSIVRSVARAHGGVVTAVPRDGGGLVVRVSIPPVRPVPPQISPGPR
jgi:signal transduction histidine kinase